MTAALVPFDLGEAKIADIIEGSIRKTQAMYFALMAHGGITQDAFAALYPGVDKAALLAGPEFARLVELWSQNSLLQHEAAQRAARANVLAAQEILRQKLDEPSCPASVAKEAADIAFKLAAQFGERPPEVCRHLTILFGVFIVSSRLDKANIATAGRPVGDVIEDVARAMRVLNRAEFDAVAQAVADAMAGGGRFTLEFPGL